MCVIVKESVCFVETCLRRREDDLVNWLSMADFNGSDFETL